MLGKRWHGSPAEFAPATTRRFDLARAGEGCWGFAPSMSCLTRLFCTLLRIPTTRLQPYESWWEGLLACLGDERRRDPLETNKCLAVANAICQCRLPKRLACLGCSYLFAQARLLFDHCEETAEQFTVAISALRQALDQARAQALSMDAASRCLITAPGMLGARAEVLSRQTRAVLKLLQRINADRITQHQFQGPRRSAERLLLQLGVRLLAGNSDRGEERLSATAIIRWMRAAEAASGRHPRELGTLYKIYKDDKHKPFSRLLREHLRGAPSPQ